MDQRFNVKCHTIILSVGGDLQYLRLGKKKRKFLDLTPKAGSIKGKHDKLNFIIIESVFLCERLSGDEKTNYRGGESACKPRI